MLFRFINMFKKILFSIPGLFTASLLIEVALFLLLLNKLPPEIPIFFSLSNSNNQIAPLIYIGILPVLTLFVLVLNYFLTLSLFQKNILLKQVFYYFNVICIVFQTYIFIKILFLVT